MFLLQFSPIDGPTAEYQPLVGTQEIERVLNELEAQYGCRNYNERHVYTIDADCWVCVAPTLEQAKSRLLSTWLDYLTARFDDGGAWFGVGEDVEKQFYEGVCKLFHEATILLHFHCEYNSNLTEYLFA
jgi:hypothetical protein